MNREDIERLANNLRQINAFGGNVNKFDKTNKQYNRNKKFDLTPDSNKIQELRATLNEARANLLKNNNYNTDEFYKTIDNIPNNKLINNIGSLNGYGDDYRNNYYLMTKIQKEEFANKIKNALKYLPAASVPLTTPIMSNKDKKEGEM